MRMIRLTRMEKERKVFLTVINLDSVHCFGETTGTSLGGGQLAAMCSTASRHQRKQWQKNERERERISRWRKEEEVSLQGK